MSDGGYRSSDEYSSTSSHPSLSSSVDDRAAERPRPRGSSVHTAAALDVVDQRRTSATRSVRYFDHMDTFPSPVSRVHATPRPRAGQRPPSTSARPATAASAAALAGVVPAGGDRLKHLQLHMEQLQQLYAQEIHKEELLRREAFVQSMCTASITLWRYVCSKPRFFTAVKALVTQYLPANDARLYEIEESGDEKLTLVLADGRAVAVHDQNAIGVVGHAVRATTQLTVTQWTAIQKNVAQETVVDVAASCASPSSSVASSTRSSSALDDEPQSSTTTRWLDHHLDCILPSTNDHVCVLLPLDRVYRDAGFDPEIDLTLKKRDLYEGSTTKQLLVVVLRDTQRRPLGALEALVATRKPLQLDFLDAFAGLLAAALEARRSICRPSTGGGLRVHIVKDDDQQTTTRPSGLELEIAPGTKMVVAGGGASWQSAENDLPLLEAVREPMAELYSQVEHWQQNAEWLKVAASAERAFWSTVVELVVAMGVDEHSETFCSDLREAVRTFSATWPTAVHLTVLFDGETLEQFSHSTSPAPEKAGLSVEAQFAALQQAIETGDTFTSTRFVTATPVTACGLKAAVLVVVDSVDTEDEADLKTHALPLVIKAIELALWAEFIENERGSARVETDLLRASLRVQERRLRENEVLVQLAERFTACRSTQDVVLETHRLAKLTQLEPRPTKITLFVAEYASAGDDTMEDHPEAERQSIWTMESGNSDDRTERVTIYDRDSVMSPRRDSSNPQQRRENGGMAAFILSTGEPLMYTPHHASYDAALRRKIYHEVDSGLYYYAVPLGLRAVIEFSFSSEDQQKSFAASAFAKSISTAVENVLELHSWMTRNLKNGERLRADAIDASVVAWNKWEAFMASMSEASGLDISAWIAATELAIKALMPRLTHANLFVRESANSDDRKLIERIAHELHESDGHASATLNVHNHAVLQSIWSFPLCGQDLLVLATSSNDTESGDGRSLASEVALFGALVSKFVRVQLSFIKIRQHGAASVQSLRESLAEVERKLLVEQEQRGQFQRQALQQSVLLQIHQLSDNLDERASVETLLSSFVQVFTRNVSQSDQGQQSLVHMGLIMLGRGENGAMAWCDNNNTPMPLQANESIWLTSTKSTTAPLHSPFEQPLEDLVSRLWPDERHDGACRVVLSSATVPFIDGLSPDLSCYTILLLPSRTDSIVDDAFMTDLVRAVDRMIVSNNQKQHHRGLQALLDTVTNEVKSTRAELEKSVTNHARWKELWKTVLGHVWSLRPSPNLVASDRDIVRKAIVEIVQHHLQDQIRACCEECKADSTVEVRIARGNSSGRNILSDTVSKWISPDELDRYLLRTRRQRSISDEDATVEFIGDLNDHVLTAYWKINRHDEHDHEGVVAICLTGCDPPESLQSVVERLLADTIELIIATENILILYAGADESASAIDKLRNLLNEKISCIEQANEASTERARIDDILTRLLTQASDSSSKNTHLEILCSPPGYSLWVQDGEEATLSCVNNDGIRQTRVYDPSGWTRSTRSCEIKVNGKRTAILEATADHDFKVQELQLLAAAIQTTLVQLELGRRVDCLSNEVVRITHEASDKAAERDSRTGEFVGHWHTVDKLLRSQGDRATDALLCADTMTRIEQAILQVAHEIVVVRFVFVEVDANNHSVVLATQVLSSELESQLDVGRRLASLLNLWSNESSGFVQTLTLSGSAAKAMLVVEALFPTLERSVGLDLMLHAIQVDRESCGSNEDRKGFLILVSLAAQDATLLPIDVCHVVEMDLRLVAIAYEHRRTLERTRRRAVEAEMALVASQEQQTEAQQWVSFLEATQHEAQQMVHMALSIPSDDSAYTWSMISAHVESFVEKACGCEGVELYGVVALDGDESRQLIPLKTNTAAHSSSARSNELSRSLEAIINATPVAAREDTTIETTAGGSRAILALYNSNRATFVGVAVMEWSQEAPSPSEPTLQVLNTIVRPWLTAVFSLIHEFELNRFAGDASTLQINGLEKEQSDLESQRMQLSERLAETDKRNGLLQSTLQSTQELFAQLQEWIALTANASTVDKLWTSLAEQVAKVCGVDGVQLYETPGEATEPRMKLSSLSNNEDAVVHKAVLAQGDGDKSAIFRRCFASPEPQECRVMFGSEYKRVRIVALNRGASSRYLLVVFSNDKRNSHQLLQMIDRLVDICITTSARRAAELERMELQETTASTLENAVEDLTGQLIAKDKTIALAQAKARWSDALFGELRRDLTDQDVWRGFEKAALAAVSTITTAKLTLMWQCLLDIAQRRIECALAEAGVATVQLYGVVSLGHDGFVFSLPSNASNRSSSKGFFCVGLSQLQERREWCRMMQCIESGTTVFPVASMTGTGSILYPMRRSTGPAQNREHRFDEDDEESEEAHGNDKRKVVGVLVVKFKGAASAIPNELVQSFADALADRTDWIGQAIDQKQQKQAQAVTPLTTGDRSRLDSKTRKRGDLLDYQGRDLQQGTGGVSAQLTEPGLTSIKAQVVKSVGQTRTTRHVSDGGDSNLRNRPVLPSNQEEHRVARPNDENDADSDDEREAERIRDRQRADITAGVLDYVLRVQSLCITDDSEPERSRAISALRSLVGREMKNVWCAHGDERKITLSTCELFFLIDGNVCDTLATSTTTLSAPEWVHDFVVTSTQQARADTIGFKLWKISAFRWIVVESVSTSSSAPSIYPLVALEGSSALSHVFDDEDEHVHLPFLMRSISAQTTQIAAAITRQKHWRDQVSAQKATATQCEMEWRSRCDELMRQWEQEEKLHHVMTRLMEATDERALIQMTLDTMQVLLKCKHVAFHTSQTSTIEPSRVRGEPTTTDHDPLESRVEMETVLRVRVLSSATSSDDHEVLGTLVARLTDSERTQIGNFVGGDGREWTLRLLQRLADSTGLALTNLRQRTLLNEVEKTLAEASAGMEKQHKEMLALQDENVSLTDQVTALGVASGHLKSVENENESLQQQLSLVQENLETSVAAKNELAKQVHQFETQLIEANCQLEQSIKAETQLVRLEEAHAVTQAREVRLERKLLKQKIQLKQLVGELTATYEKHERDQAELIDLRKQVALLTEKQQHRGGMDASSVATAVMQAQAQAMAQSQAIHHQQSQSELKQQQHQQRMQAVVQRRLFRQLQLQQHQQKRKQLDLAQELRQLTALEVQEMTRRSSADRVEERERRSERELTSAGIQYISTCGEDAKIHSLRSEAAVQRPERNPEQRKVPAHVPERTVEKMSRLQPPRIVVMERRNSTIANKTTENKA